MEEEKDKLIPEEQTLKEESKSISGWRPKKEKRKVIADLRKEYELKRFRNTDLQFK
jgi:hypothetical protein